MNFRMLHGHHLAVLEAKSASEFRDRVIRFTKGLGFDLMSAMAVIDHSKTHSSFYGVDNTPDAFREIWLDPGLAKIDPVMQHGKRSSIPLIWDRGTYAAKGCEDLWEQQAPFGFKTGIAVTLHLPGDQHFFIGLDRDKPLNEGPSALTRMVAELQLFAVHAQESGIRILAAQSDFSTVYNVPRLTARELEALRWTMDGKAAREIGETLNISERTAVFHLQNATRKLGCKSKFHAVLTAIRLGLMT